MKQEQQIEYGAKGDVPAADSAALISTWPLYLLLLIEHKRSVGGWLVSTVLK